VHEKFERAWGVKLSDKAGLTSTQALPAAAKGELKGLYIFGEDPMVTDPDTGHVRKALENLDFLVVQELFMTETAKFAHVVLPGMSYAEKEGTFTNTERRVQRVRKAVQLAGDMRLDTDIFYDVMNRMGYACQAKDAAGIMDEIASSRRPSRASATRGWTRAKPCSGPATIRITAAPAYCMWIRSRAHRPVLPRRIQALRRAARRGIPLYAGDGRMLTTITPPP
jgi:anaerobic selenocysteine-containing dehydrogenase